MVAPPLPANEAARLSALERYDILDTEREQAYDDFTALAAHICGTPMALIGLIDDKRQWFKSKFNMDGDETPRELTFCGHTLIDNQMLVVDDTFNDHRFHDHPSVTGAPKIRFYAGAPIATRTVGFAAWLIVAALLAVGFDAASRMADWNFVFARLGVVVVWLCVLGGAIRLVRVAGGATVFVVAALLILVAHVAFERLGAPLAAAAPTTPALRWAVDLIRPPAEGPSELFAILPAHTNITGVDNGRPLSVDWAPLTGGPSAVRPDIFVFVVDSLRRDYLQPYNPRATFTPAIASFAA